MKKMSGIVLVAVTVLSSFSFALDCNERDMRAKDIQSLPGVGYWMQAFGDCKLTYTGVGGVGSKLYDYCKKQSEPFPNGIDPFPIPSPDDFVRNNMYVRPGIRFYTLADNQNPFKLDLPNSGVYQSIGMLPSATPNETRIRIAVGWERGRFVDYKIKKVGNGKYDVTPEQSKPVKVCTNIPGNGLDNEIPVISRNGVFIAARAQDNGNTKIYRIKDGGNEERSCELVAEIPGGPTGKVSFDFNNDHVMYVVKDPVSGKGRLMQLSLKTGIIRTISGPDEDVMYMTSKPNGDIIYTRRIAGNYQSSGTSALVFMDSKDLQDLARSDHYETLGLLWAASCKKQIDLDYALAMGQRMSAEACNTVVNKVNYDKLSAAERRKTSFASLQQICSHRGPGNGGLQSPAPVRTNNPSTNR